MLSPAKKKRYPALEFHPIHPSQLRMSANLVARTRKNLHSSHSCSRVLMRCPNYAEMASHGESRLSGKPCSVLGPRSHRHLQDPPTQIHLVKPLQICFCNVRLECCSCNLESSHWNKPIYTNLPICKHLYDLHWHIKPRSTGSLP